VDSKPTIEAAREMLEAAGELVTEAPDQMSDEDEFAITFPVAFGHALATLALAEQVKRIADAMERRRMAKRWVDDETIAAVPGC
jgi:hypothetical protein